MQGPPPQPPATLANGEWAQARTLQAGWRNNYQVYLDNNMPVPIYRTPQGSYTLFDMAFAYVAPQFIPTHFPPPAAGGHLFPNVSGNTESSGYSLEDVKIIHSWHIDQNAILQRFGQMLYQPYDPSALGAGLARFTCTLRHFTPSFIGAFRNEQGLVSRLDASAHLELARFFEYMFRAHSAPNILFQWVQDGVPIFPEVGSAAKPKQNYLPDRTAKSDRHNPPSEVRGRLFGDIKPSYKFSGSWRVYAAQNGMEGIPTSREYRKVLAQVKYYMRDVGLDPERQGRACRYGFVETDEEVVLLRFNPAQGKNSIEASDGFPWRAQRNGVNGFLALVYIHLLASLREDRPDGYLV